jgi:hypothetical protein
MKTTNLGIVILRWICTRSIDNDGSSERFRRPSIDCLWVRRSLLQCPRDVAPVCFGKSADTPTGGCVFHYMVSRGRLIHWTWSTLRENMYQTLCKSAAVKACHWSLFIAIAPFWQPPNLNPCWPSCITNDISCARTRLSTECNLQTFPAIRLSITIHFSPQWASAEFPPGRSEQIEGYARPARLPQLDNLDLEHSPFRFIAACPVCL